MNGRRRRQERRPPMDYVYGLDAVINFGAAKASQAFKYASLAHAGYKLGKKFYDTLKRPRSPSDSFPENEKTMAPAGRSRSPRSQQLQTPTRRGRQSSRGSMDLSRSASRPPPSVRFVRASSAPPTPGFSRKYMGRKSFRTAGASGSKSAGKFKKARGKQGLYDVYVRRGIGRVIERGGVIATTAALPGQTILIGHATCTTRMILDLWGYGMIKYCASLLKRDIQDINDLIIGTPGREEQFIIYYQRNIAGTMTDATSTLDITSTIKWIDAANSFVNLFDAIQGNSFKMLKMEWYQKSVATTPVVSREKLFSVTLDKCRIHMYVKSALKIQNRTVNVAANIEADDVDNVPLYGKQYESSKNYFQTRSKTLVVDTEGFYGQNTFAVDASLAEPPSLAQVKSANAISSAKLDPGSIKTSVLTYKSSFLMNDIFKTLYLSPLIDPSNTAQLKFGSSRWFCLEKMIQAVATTDVNGLKVAYELDAKQACYVTNPQSKVTTNLISLIPI